MHVDRSWLTVIVAIFGVRWFLAGSALQRGKVVAGAVHFRGSTAIRLLFGVGAPIAFYGAGVVVSSSNFKTDWWVSIVLACVGISVILMWPEEIITKSTGIAQSRFFGIGNRGISWFDVDYATENVQNGNIEVVSKTGSKIIHTQLHVGHDDFLEVVRSHCRMF